MPPPPSERSLPGVQRSWPARLVRRIRLALQMRKLYLLRAEFRFAPTESQRLIVLTVVIGALCGFSAVAFHLAIRLVETLVIRDHGQARGASWIAGTLLTPALGALVAGLLLHFVAPNARGSGIPQVKAAFAHRDTVRLRDALWKFLICAIQIGSGSSLGREGPTVHICAGVSGAIRRVPGVSAKNLRRLLPVGAAAGIAAAFNAPIAAVTFTIEEVVGKLDQAVLSGVIIAAAVAAVIERSVLGEHPVLGDIPRTYGLHHASSLLIYTLLGLAAAVVSIVFRDLLLYTRTRFQRSSLPPWVRPAVGGLSTGALALLALMMFDVRGVTGGGYETLMDTLRGNLGVKVMLVLCSLKILATIGSYSSGGAGGIFAPSLFIGATLGGAFGALDNWLLGHNEPIGAFALVGMGAVFAGIIRAPITSVLIIIEMTGGYSLILPLMIANMTSYVVAHATRPVAIYEALLEQDGIHVAHADEAIDELPINEIVDREGRDVRSFTRAASAAEVTRGTLEARQEVYPVVDGENRVIGLITTEELKILSSEPELAPLVNAADLMRPPASVALDTDVRTALESMISYGTRQLPVTDGEGRCIGLLHESDIVRAYLRVHRHHGPHEARGETLRPPS